jgi:hypothetical protein
MTTTVGNRQYNTLRVGKNGGQKWKQEHLAVYVKEQAYILPPCVREN